MIGQGSPQAGIKAEEVGMVWAEFVTTSIVTCYMKRDHLELLSFLYGWIALFVQKISTS